MRRALGVRAGSARGARLLRGDLTWYLPVPAPRWLDTRRPLSGGRRGCPCLLILRPRPGQGGWGPRASSRSASAGGRGLCTLTTFTQGRKPSQRLKTQLQPNKVILLSVIAGTPHHYLLHCLLPQDTAELCFGRATSQRFPVHR